MSKQEKYFFSQYALNTNGSIQANLFSSYEEAEAAAIKEKVPYGEVINIRIYKQTVEAVARVVVRSTREVVKDDAS